MLRRTLNPETRVIDDRAGVVEYIASDESIDAQGEVIRANGWRFDRFQKNAPFVDSHRYGSIEFQLGTVVDHKVQGSQLIETVQWAIDVPENRLAQLGWAMTQAGFLKAVSVGFSPTKVVTTLSRDQWPEDWDGAMVLSASSPGGKQLWGSQIQQLQCGKEKPISIFVEQQQLELSACIIGANPNALTASAKMAVVKSYKAGVLSDDDLAWLCPDNPEAIHRHASPVYSFPSEPAKAETETLMKAKSLEQFDHMSVETRSAHDDVESVRRNGNLSEIVRAVQRTFKELDRERKGASDEIGCLLKSNPALEEWIEVVVRRKAGFEKLVSKGLIVPKGLMVPSDAMAGAFDIPVSEDILNITLQYGASRDFVKVMTGQKTKFANLTQIPDAAWITSTVTTLANRTIPEDTSITGESITETANALGVLLTISIELVQDGKISFARAVLEAITQGLAKGLDRAVFIGDGTDNQTYGGQTGIFADVTIQNVNAGLANTTVAALQRPDFLRVVGSIAPGALQRTEKCRWWINPKFIASLLSIKDGPSGRYLLKTPAETQGEWMLVGFPVSWAAAAPGTDGAANQIAAFGNSDAYLVAIRDQMEMISSDGSKLQNVERQTRAVLRGRAETRGATGLVILKTAAA